MTTYPTSNTPGVGPLLQLNALGEQDNAMYDLLGEGSNPFTADTFVKSTAGAVEQKEESFQTFTLGQTNNILLDRRGDMLGGVALEIKLPALANAGINDYWKENIGYILLRKIRLFLNDAELESSERLWYHIYDNLFLPDNIREGVLSMIGGNGPNTLRLSQEHIILVPLKLFHCKRHGQRQVFLPMITYYKGSTLSIEIETESFENSITSYAGNDEVTTLETKLIVDYVFLSQFERERLINKSFPVMVETVQDVEGYSFKEVRSSEGDIFLPTNTVSIDMSEVNYPVKYLAFVAYSSSDLRNKNYFKYSDIIDTVTIRFDGQDRTEKFDSKYFNLVQPFYYAKRCTDDHIFMYSFALHPHDMQPSGHFTFRNIRKPSVYITLKEKRRDIVVKCFIVGYRWITFAHGEAQVLYL
jgi:hypothetical protein